jgi:hypothetical protein
MLSAVINTGLAWWLTWKHGPEVVRAKQPLHENSDNDKIE